MAGSRRETGNLNPLTSHFIVFVTGILIGVIIQPSIVSHTSQQLLIPAEQHIVEQLSTQQLNCPKCPTCQCENNEVPNCPECPPQEKCPEKTESECEPCESNQSDLVDVVSEEDSPCQICPVCEEKENTGAAIETACDCPEQGEGTGGTEAMPVWWPRAQEDWFPDGVQKKFKAAMQQGWWFLGCKSDVDEVLDILKPFYRGPDIDGVVIDIGANLGQVTEHILQTFGNIPWNRYKRKFGLDGIYCKNDPQPGVEVFMFEPNPHNAKRIRERMDFSHWGLERVHLIQAAVSNYTGSASFYFAGSLGETGNLKKTVAKEKGKRSTVEVEVLSLDDAHSRYMRNKKIFMLKTDVEGFDGRILRGASTLLEQQTIRFLTFEYHGLWFDNTDDTLKDTLAYLDKFGFICYLILPKRLLPLSGKFWQPMFETKKWSNVFCGHSDDFLMEKVVLMYNMLNLREREDEKTYSTKNDAMEWMFTDKVGGSNRPGKKKFEKGR